MTTDTLSQPAVKDSMELDRVKQMHQYALWQILGIWALATLPMVLLGWVIAPILLPRSSLHPGITYWLLMIAGMAWQFIVSLVIMYRELGTLRWSAIRERTWLQTPRDPKTDKPNPRLFWWLLPLLVLDGLWFGVLAGYVDAPMARLFPVPAWLPDTSQLATPEYKGQWWLLGVILVSHIFNYFLGEEFLFRGVLLPKMQGVFGKYDWVANAVLFGLYHMHKPWSIPGNIIGSLPLTWPARRFRSNWMAIIIHGAEGLLPLVLVLAVILGLVG
jgi:membrane protease YdiL (CAAX protease family)